MAVPPESIEVGKCYLSNDGRVRRAAKFLPDGRIRYAYRSFPVPQGRLWRTGRLDVERFAETTVLEVPCDWTPVIPAPIDRGAEEEDPLSGGATRMVAMDGFDHLLNWKLKVGSHPFPGPDGGTCINEAALVAAGFEYRSICAAHEMPDCFSRPICHLAMFLNDDSTDKERQRLLPYVTRLACADIPSVEKARAKYIKKHLSNYHYYGVPFDKGLEVLEGALAIGRQADPLGPDEGRTRMDTVRARQSTPVKEAPASSTDKPLVSKIKSWLAMKEIEPLA